MKYKITVTDNEINEVVREVESDCIVATVVKKADESYVSESIMALAGKRDMFSAAVLGTLNSLSETCTKMFGSTILLDLAITAYLEGQIKALNTEVKPNES